MADPKLSSVPPSSRSIVEAMSIEQLASGVIPKSEGEEVTGPFEMYEPWKYAVHKWGMTIDVNA